MLRSKYFLKLDSFVTLDSAKKVYFERGEIWTFGNGGFVHYRSDCLKPKSQNLSCLQYRGGFVENVKIFLFTNHLRNFKNFYYTVIRNHFVNLVEAGYEAVC
ncbi:hypothetical protein BGP_5302 [Beggiatoa sp. PS]|nr:hypothetical protein BGP_5302 [Beggiatoa sp. PS]